MRTFVWVDSWQQQCCGDDFQVGSDVSWSLVPQEPSSEWVELLLGRDWAERVAFHEEHHGDEELPKTLGTVRSIREVTCRRQPRADGALVPIPNSGMLKEVVVADKWSAEPPEELQRLMTFDGWIVELEISRAVV